MKVLVITVMFLFFFVYPTWAIFQQQITIRRVTIYQDKTPLTFWSLIGFFYYCGFAFPYIMWQMPYANVFLYLMYFIAAIHIMMYILKW